MQVCEGYLTTARHRLGQKHEPIVVADILHCPLCKALEDQELLERQLEALKEEVGRAA